MSTTSTREFKCHQNENYKFKNTSLFTSLKVKTVKGIVVHLVINGVKFSYTKSTNKFYVFDIAVIRNICRDSLGMTEEENNLIRLENTFGYNSLSAMSHYKTIPIDTLNNSIFSEDLEIRFELEGKNLPQTIEVVETYIVSDVHRETYQS